MKAAKTLAKRVAPIYKMMKWEWETTGIPDEFDIYERLMELYKDIQYKNKDSVISTGGLEVEKFKNEEGDWEVEFSFKISETDYEGWDTDEI